LGDLHTHTNWSDGAAALQTMGEAAKQNGLKYLAVSSTDWKPRRMAIEANSSCIFAGKSLSVHAGVVFPLTMVWLDGGVAVSAIATARLDLPNARAS